MSTIKAYTDYDFMRDQFYYTNFEIVDKTPQKGDVITGNPRVTETVEEVEKLCLSYSQPSDKCYKYDYYKVTTKAVEEEFDGTVTVTDYTYYYAVEEPGIDYDEIFYEFKVFYENRQCAYSNDYEWVSTLLDTWLINKYGEVILNTEEKEEIINDILSERETV